MKLMHLSDLHLGKRVNDYPMLPDQKYILEQILAIADEEKPDGVLIAGDVYDKSVAPAEAVELFDSFLVALSRKHILFPAEITTVPSVWPLGGGSWMPPEFTCPRCTMEVAGRSRWKIPSARWMCICSPS